MYCIAERTGSLNYNELFGLLCFAETGPNKNVTFWRPRAPANYVVLGDCVTSGYILFSCSQIYLVLHSNLLDCAQKNKLQEHTT